MEILQEKLLGIDQASDFLGLSKITVYKMISAKKIPFIKIGKRVLFDVTKLREWLESKTVLPIS